MSKVATSVDSQSFAQIPEFSNSQPGGLESRRIVEQLEGLAIALDAQANTLDEWREETIQFLLRPLVDEDEGLELTGNCQSFEGSFPFSCCTKLTPVFHEQEMNMRTLLSFRTKLKSTYKLCELLSPIVTML